MYKEMMDTIGLVNTVDPELGAAMNRELTRQRQNIELIASENIVSPAVMAAMGRGLPHKGRTWQCPHQQVRRGPARQALLRRLRLCG